MVSDLVKGLVCLGLAAGLLAVAGLSIPSSPDMRTMSGYAEADALRSYEHPEDEFCSGATPDCPSHWEAWDSLPPTMD